MSCDRARDVVAGGETERRFVAEHLRECEECRSLLLATGILDGALARASRPGTPCPGEETLAAVLDGSLDARPREEVTAHLAACERCAPDVLSLARDLESLRDARELSPPAGIEERVLRSLSAPKPYEASAPRVPRWRSLLSRRRAGFALAGSAAAVLLAIGIRYSVDWRSSGPASTVLRGTAASRVAAVSPRGEVRDVEILRFLWTWTPSARDVPATVEPSRARRYRLVVVDLATGKTLVDRVTTEMSYPPSPEEVALLRPGVRYHWLVEPLDDASGGASETTAFWLRP